jgi:crotonobetainyl-CoA:carnitine CoA-transferase CaiB-like acyl-CoA transferase
MTFLYAGMAAAGAAAAGWGLWAAHRFKAPWDIAAAMAALTGIATFFIGILLAVLPNFFTT